MESVTCQFYFDIEGLAFPERQEDVDKFYLLIQDSLKQVDPSTSDNACEFRILRSYRYSVEDAEDRTFSIVFDLVHSSSGEAKAAITAMLPYVRQGLLDMGYSEFEGWPEIVEKLGSLSDYV